MVEKLKASHKIALREMNEFKCKQCKKHEDEVGTLEAHRIKRGSAGGKYVSYNILMLCKECHKKIHEYE